MANKKFAKEEVWWIPFASELKFGDRQIQRCTPIRYSVASATKNQKCQNSWSRRLVCATCGGGRKRSWPLFSPVLGTRLFLSIRINCFEKMVKLLSLSIRLFCWIKLTLVVFLSFCMVVVFGSVWPTGRKDTFTLDKNKRWNPKCGPSQLYCVQLSVIHSMFGHACDKWIVVFSYSLPGY